MADQNSKVLVRLERGEEMRRIGAGEMAARAQARLAADARFDEMLAMEKGNGLLLYEMVAPHAQPQLGYYAEWARIAPHDERHSVYTLSVKQGRRWVATDFEGTLEQCLDELRRFLR